MEEFVWGQNLLFLSIHLIAPHTPAAAYKKLPEDVFGAFNHNFNSDHFSKQEGYYFPEMIAHPEKYLQPCSAKLKDWLAGLRRSGKHIFLLTNSHG